jgi:hypothetical protein
MRHLLLVSIIFILPVCAVNGLLQKNNKIQMEQEDRGQECSICLLNVSYRDKWTLPKRGKNCGHSFHRNCLDQWLNSKRECPECKTKLSKTSLLFARTKRMLFHAFCLSCTEESVDLLNHSNIVEEQLGLLSLQGPLP